MARVVIEGQSIVYPSAEDLGVSSADDIEPVIISQARRGGRLLNIRLSLETGLPEFWAELSPGHESSKRAAYAPVSHKQLLALLTRAKEKYVTGLMQARMADILMDDIAKGKFDVEAIEAAFLARSA